MYAWKKFVFQGFFCDTFRLKSLIKDAACYKNPENPRSFDLILTNNPRSFHNSCVLEIGLSDFHKMVVIIMKTSFERLHTEQETLTIFLHSMLDILFSGIHTSHPL